MFLQPPDDFSLPSLLSSQWRFHRNTLVMWLTFFAFNRDELKRGNDGRLTATCYSAANVNFACFSLPVENWWWGKRTGDTFLMHFYEFHVLILFFSSRPSREKLHIKTKAVHIGCLLMKAGISTATDAIRRSNENHRDLYNGCPFASLVNNKN